MRKIIITILFVVGIIYGSLSIGDWMAKTPDMGVALLAGVVAASACAWPILRDKSFDKRFLLRLFVGALLLRWIAGYLIYSKGLQAFLGADAGTYDIFGNLLLQSWTGQVDASGPWFERITSAQTSGWGMYYYVAGIYYLIGQNPFAIQLINGALGAVACFVAYKIAMIIYPSQRVARLAALFTAFSPSLILWSSQLLKDGLIVLTLCLCMLFTLKLRDRFDGRSFVLLLISLFCLYSLRNYAAYILFIAMTGTLLFAAKKFSPVRILQGGILIVLLGTSLAYFAGGDVQQIAERSFDLKRIQNARVWGAQAAESGYGGDVDITEPEAAIGFLPVGISYVLLAPFPWMITNLRQLITLPELVIWWALIPMLLKGLWHSMRHRLRESFSMIVFSISLTVAYALYQTNVGTAYRHRAQLFVFFFVFISIGLEVSREAKRKKKFEASLNQARVSPRVQVTVQAAGTQTR